MFYKCIQIRFFFYFFFISFSGFSLPVSFFISFYFSPFSFFPSFFYSFPPPFPSSPPHFSSSPFPFYLPPRFLHGFYSILSLAPFFSFSFHLHRLSSSSSFFSSFDSSLLPPSLTFLPILSLYSFLSLAVSSPFLARFLHFSLTLFPPPFLLTPFSRPSPFLFSSLTHFPFFFYPSFNLITFIANAVAIYFSFISYRMAYILQ